MGIQTLLANAKKIAKTIGIYDLLGSRRERISIIMDRLRFAYYSKRRDPTATFEFQGKVYSYFWHSVGYAGINERSVEIPIIWNIVKNNTGKMILEVGNVLSHYFKIDHDIVDKYEIRDHVINEDIVDFYAPEKYDLIVSISTLEHVGWDEHPRESMKILRAFDNLIRCLAPGGKIIATLPLGFNLEMDQLLKDNQLPLSEAFYLKRISTDNHWIQVRWEDIEGARYGDPFHCANALVIGVVEKGYT